jgi:hypothetical protein
MTTTYGLWFRRYAPFERFGSLAIGSFEGDNRGPSTSLRVTSRTYCCIMFRRSGIVRSFANSSGTRFDPYLGPLAGGSVTGHSDVRHRVASLPHDDGFRIRASSHGGNPLTPSAVTPDIDVYVDVRVGFGTNTIEISGEAFGDNFPALEIFLYSYRSARAAMLLDGRTTGGANTGPPTRLEGTNSWFRLGSFHVRLRLAGDGELAANTTVPPTTLASYPVWQQRAMMAVREKVRPFW